MSRYVNIILKHHRKLLIGSGVTLVGSSNTGTLCDATNIKEFKSPSTGNAKTEFVYYKKTEIKWFVTTRVFTTETGMTGPGCVYIGNDGCYTITMSPEGKMTISIGYGWNGPSGSPSFDSMMRGSCMHDAMYTLFAKSAAPITKYDRDTYKPLADKLLRQMFIEDGCPVWVADTALALVTNFSCFFEE